MKKETALIVLALNFFACQTDDSTEVITETVEGDFSLREDLDNLNLPSIAFNYSDIDLPDHFMTRAVRRADNTPDDNPVTNEGATLGRVLFYDNALSLNFEISCASCHTQETGFTDENTFSTGFQGRMTRRNSMSLSNARFYKPEHFFWDERAETLEDQVLLPIQDPIEMGMTLDALEERLSSTDYYPILFEEAFGDDSITQERISLALAQFIRGMISYQSKYDQAIIANAGDEEGDLPLLLM